MEMLEIMKQRHSVRQYTDRAIDRKSARCWMRSPQASTGKLDCTFR